MCDELRPSLASQHLATIIAGYQQNQMQWQMQLPMPYPMQQPLQMQPMQQPMQRPMPCPAQGHVQHCIVSVLDNEHDVQRV